MGGGDGEGSAWLMDIFSLLPRVPSSLSTDYTNLQPHLDFSKRTIARSLSLLFAQGRRVRAISRAGGGDRALSFKPKQTQKRVDDRPQ